MRLVLPSTTVFNIASCSSARKYSTHTHKGCMKQLSSSIQRMSFQREAQCTKFFFPDWSRCFLNRRLSILFFSPCACTCDYDAYVSCNRLSRHRLSSRDEITHGAFICRCFRLLDTPPSLMKSAIVKAPPLEGKGFSQYEAVFLQLADEHRTVNAFELQELLEACLPNGTTWRFSIV